MNLDKKRKRQAGRQARKVQVRYSIWIDDAGKVHSKLYKGRVKDSSHTECQFSS